MTAGPVVAPGDVEARLAEVLAGHQYVTLGPSACTCGSACAEGYQAHLAAVLAPVVADEVARAVEAGELKALRECVDLYCNEDKALIAGWANTLAAHMEAKP